MRRLEDGANAGTAPLCAARKVLWRGVAWRDAADILIKIRCEKGAQAHDLMRAGARCCDAAGGWAVD